MKAVLFDLYETLVTENHPEWHVRAPAPGERLGMPQEQFNREWSARYGARMSGRLRLYGDVLRDICRACRIDPPEEEITSMQAERMAAKARPFERLDPAVVETLRALETEGYRIGLVSNCAHDETAAWGSSELSALVEEPVYSCVEGLIKPNPAIYHLTCDRLGVDAGSAVFVGDGGSDELRGADAAGLKPIWATWFIERWPWNWVEKAARTSDAFPRCRRIEDLTAIIPT